MNGIFRQLNRRKLVFYCECNNGELLNIIIKFDVLRLKESTIAGKNMEEKKQKRLKMGAQIGLIILLLNVVGQLAAVYQTRYQLVSPIISESIIWEINKQFVFHAFVSAVASIAGLLIYFFDKYLLVIIFVALVLITDRFLYV